MPLLETSGGLLLPAGVTTTVLSGGSIAGSSRQIAKVIGSGAMRGAPTQGRQPALGPLVSFQDVYVSQPDVAAVINKITRNFTRVPLQVAQRTPTGEITPVTDPQHPLRKLLEHPSDRRGAVELKQWMAFPLLLHGNALLLKHRADPEGPPTELHPLTWEQMAAYRRPGGFIDLWATSEMGRVTPLAPSEVVHFAWQAASGPAGEVGVSPLNQLAATVRVQDAARRFTYSQLVNAARPGGAFKLPPDVELTDELIGELRTVIEAWSGVDAAGGTPVIGGGAEWEIHEHTAQEAELISTRRLTREEICMVYDVSPTVIGVLENATQRGNVAELNADFFGNTLAPYFTLIAGVLNSQLIEPEPAWRDEGLLIRFDASEFLRGDPLKWAQAMEARVRSGGLTINERRDLDGQPRFDDERADEPIIAANNLRPLSMIDELDQTVTPPAPAS